MTRLARAGHVALRRGRALRTHGGITLWRAILRRRHACLRRGSALEHLLLRWRGTRVAKRDRSWTAVRARARNTSRHGQGRSCLGVFLRSFNNLVAAKNSREYRMGRDMGVGAYSRRFRAAQRTTHSTQSSLPSPSVCQTAFSSGDFPEIVMRVPPPLGPGGFFWILPNSMRFGGMLWPA